MSILDIFKTEKNDGRTPVLIAEDSRTQAMQLEFLLEEAGYAVTVARNGKEAVEALGKRVPAILISDIVMPEMDGYELCLHVKTEENLKNIPVILMTSLADPNEAVKGLYCGADVLIAKPYDGDYLLARVKTMLENQTLKQSENVDEETGPKGIRVSIGGRKHFVTNERLQTIDLLLSAYEIAIQKNKELEKAQNRIEELEEQLKKVQA